MDPIWNSKEKFIGGNLFLELLQFHVLENFWVIYFSFNRYVGKNESLTISVWNQRKVYKGRGAGFLGCVRVTPLAIERLKDQGCKI